MSDKNPAIPSEIELKLLFAPEDRLLLERCITMKMGASPAVTRSLLTTYYDTPELLLSHSGFALRVRKSGRKRIQTLKSQGDDSGLASNRGEWEWVITTDAPDLDLLSGTPAEALRPKLLGKLQPIWVSDVQRTIHMLEYAGATVELAIDEGTVRAGDQKEDFQEVELELKSGSVTALYQLALALQADVPLRLGTVSKAERGYRLRTGTSAVSVQAKIPPPNKDITVLKGFRSLVRAGLGGMVGNLSAAEAGDLEGIHQMRVAIRQLRTIFKMFENYTDPRSVTGFQKELGRIGRVLGTARDWDVFCVETLPAAFDGDTSSSALNEAASARRRAAHQILRDELATPALTALLLSITVWVEADPLLQNDAFLNAPLSDIAPKLLDHAARKVKKRGHHISQLSMEELHAFRKALKKLRYGSGYFFNLYPSGAVTRFMKLCKKLQNSLGDINDAVVAANLMDTLKEANSDLVAVANAFQKWNEKRRQQALKSLPKQWKDFRDNKPFWQ
ncbi:CHAD domain-containing protein [Acetobacter sp.]|uniref:CYTH and CHAD domain-containing protein n=1 Tax=Acetobacter sp. TaxID=440 RepID=UPI0039E8B74B